MKTFKLGGIHPEENKLARNSKVEVFPLPKKAVIFVSQHLGAPSVPVVKKGDRVKTGKGRGVYLCKHAFSFHGSDNKD